MSLINACNDDKLRIQFALPYVKSLNNLAWTKKLKAWLRGAGDEASTTCVLHGLHHYDIVCDPQHTRRWG